LSDSFILQKVLPGDERRFDDIRRVVEELQSLDEDKAWRVDIEQVKSKRGTDANAYYWGVVVELMAQATGYEPEEIHEYLCGTRWGWKDKRVPKTPRNPAGLESIPVRTTTTNANGKRSVLAIMEFYEFVEFARRFAEAKLNITTPDPDPEWKSKANESEAA
jgi:hypothetical protein